MHAMHCMATRSAAAVRAMLAQPDGDANPPILTEDHMELAIVIETIQIDAQLPGLHNCICVLMPETLW